MYIWTLCLNRFQATSLILGAKQLFDAYLLTLPRQHKAVFLTFVTKLRELAGTGGKAEVLGI